MKNIAPRITGETLDVARNQIEYAPVVALLATHPDFGWLCPLCRRYRQPDFTECGGPEFAEHPLYYRKEGLAGGFNTVVMCFELDGEERQRIINGENLYISMLTYGRPQTPINLSVGPEEMAERYGLEVIHRGLRVTSVDGLFDEEHSRADDDGMAPAPAAV